MRWLAAFPLLAIALTASGQLPSMTVEPPITNPHRSVDVAFGDAWGDGCVPQLSSVSVSGSTVNIDFSVAGDICTQNVVPWSPIVHLGTFAPGVYDLVASIPRSNITIGRAQLIVRDVDYVHFKPSVVIGATPMYVLTDDLTPVTSVTVGGASAAVRGDGTFVPPAHAPGTVDVTVNLGDGRTLVMKSALTYDDPAAPPDRRFFEPVFFPIAYRGAGAFGSSWSTTNRVTSTAGAVYFRTALPCSGCGSTTGDFSTVLDTNDDPSGILLYALRETSAGLDVSSRVRELTRPTNGTSIPVAREHDFVMQDLRFLDVPLAAHARTMLRVRTLGDVAPGTLLGVGLNRDANNFKAVPFTGNSVAVDLTSLLAAAGGSGELDLTVSTMTADGAPLLEPIWGFVTVTDDATQQVTVVTP